MTDTATPPKITALAPWFGGKRTLAARIVAELGPHAAYWEPFCGSMAVLLAKEPSSHETANDLHGDLTNFATVVASDGWRSLYERLQRTFFAEKLFRAVRDRDPQTAEDRAYRFFVESWMGRNGVAGTRASNTAFCVRYTSNGGDPGRRFVNAVESMPWWHERLRHVWIVNRDGFELLERIEDADRTVIYCDPPYLVKGADYVHDFAAADHGRLAKTLARFKRTRVIVSYYAHADLNGLYPGWTQVTFDVSKAMAHQGSRGTNDTRATEVLLINGPSLSQPANERTLFSA